MSQVLPRVTGGEPEAGERLRDRGGDPGLAVLAIRQDRAEVGLRLAGAVDRLRETAGGEAPPLIVGLDDPREVAKSALTESEITALLEEGRAMSLDDASPWLVERASEGPEGPQGATASATAAEGGRIVVGEDPSDRKVKRGLVRLQCLEHLRSPGCGDADAPERHSHVLEVPAVALVDDAIDVRGLPPG